MEPLHTLFCGPTGAGKTELALKEFFGSPPGPTVLIDLHGGFVEKAGQKGMEYGMIQTGQMLLDRFCDFHFGCGVDFLKGSRNPDPDEREAENRDLIYQAVSVFMALEDKTDSLQSPGIHEALTHVFNLLIYQKTPVPLYFARDALNPLTGTYHYLLNNCTDERTVLKAKEYLALPPQSKVVLVAPANRRLERYFSSPHINARCAETVDLVKHLQQGGSFLWSGAHRNREDKQIYANFLLNMLFNAAMDEAFENLTILMDEGQDGGLLNKQWAAGARQLRKYNTRLACIVQDPFILPDDVLFPLMQNFKRQFIFRQNDPKAARIFAERIEIPQLDLLDEKSREYTTRTVTTGYEEIPTETKTTNARRETSTTKGTRERAVHREIQDAHIKHFTGEEKILLRQKGLMAQVHEYHEISPTYLSSSPETFELVRFQWEGLRLPDGMPLGEYKLDEALKEQHKRNPVYQLKPVKYAVSPPKNSNGQNGKATTKSGKKGNQKRFTL